MLPREQIKAILIAHGFTERQQPDGAVDLNPYCYTAVEECIVEALKALSKPVYKIRSKTSGLYSTGGAYPRFTKHGKVWGTVGHLRNHLSMFNDRLQRSPELFAHWEILELPSVQEALPARAVSLAEFLAKK